MRGNQEAYVLVKIKDGRKYVCALNKLKAGKKSVPVDRGAQAIDLEKDVLWQ